jgi:hypothetical protein
VIDVGFLRNVLNFLMLTYFIHIICCTFDFIVKTSKWNVKTFCMEIYIYYLQKFYCFLFNETKFVKGKKRSKIGISHSHIICKFWCHGSSLFCAKFHQKAPCKGLWVKAWNIKPKTMSNHVQNYTLIYIPMWCPFYNMLIMASCALWLIWMLRNLNWSIASIDFEFGFEQRNF